jgi:hypothetical protein
MGGGKGGGSAPAPDRNIGLAALQNAALGKEWLSFAREQFKEANIRQADIDELTKRIGESQLTTQDQANQWSRDDRARWESEFKPIEDEIITEAKRAGGEEAQAAAAAAAKADVLGSAQAQKRAGEINMASMGVNPNSGRWNAAADATNTQVALASAGAQNTARNMERDRGIALKADAANMGRGLPSQAASGAALGLQAGNYALGGAMGAQGSFINNTGIMGQGFQGAMQGNSSMANILNQQHQNQLQAWSANQQAAGAGWGGLMQGIGTLGGAAMSAGIISDENKKKGKKKIKDGEALEAVKGMPVEEWQYKKGVADEGKHVGTYAQDFKAQTGKGDGKTIPVQDAIGVTMKAIQDLDSKVEKMNKRGKK